MEKQGDTRMVQREGHYDYMLRRYREEQDKTAEKKWDYENPLLRAKIGDLEAQIDIMKKDHQELTAAYYSVLNRLKEVTSGVSSEPLSEYEEKNWERHRIRMEKASKQMMKE